MIRAGKWVRAFLPSFLTCCLYTTPFLFPCLSLCSSHVHVQARVPVIQGSNRDEFGLIMAAAPILPLIPSLNITIPMDMSMLNRTIAMIWYAISHVVIMIDDVWHDNRGNDVLGSIYTAYKPSMYRDPGIFILLWLLLWLNGGNGW
jgi:hypothetical protein